MRLIKLTQNKFSIVDNIDFLNLSRFKWHLTSNGYAKGKRKLNDKWQNVSLHRFLLNPPLDKEIDHINGDRLDNRRRNLRIVNHSQNQQNAIKPNTNTSGFKGVTWKPKSKKWQSYIMVAKKFIYLGLYSSKEEAARFYNQAAVKYFGEFARLN